MYCHLETTSHQMPKKMRDQAEQFAVSPEVGNNKATLLSLKKRMQIVLRKRQTWGKIIL